MLSLLELQRDMARALLGGDDGALAHLVAGDGMRPGDRLDIHRNNVVSSLTAVLAGVFPVIRRLGDERFFAYAAHEFIIAHPPERPVLAGFGARFAAFLAAFPPCRDFPYFADVAQLEWLLHAAAGAPELPALSAAALAGLAPEAAPRLTLSLQPSCGWLRSRYPVDLLWQSNRGGDATPVDLGCGSAALEVRRVGKTAGFRRLAPAVLALRAALGEGRTLESAADAALALDADFDLNEALPALFAEGAVVAIGNGG